MTTKLSNILDAGRISDQFSLVSGGTGLTRTFRGGFLVRLNVVTTVPGNTITIADDDTTFIYIDTNTGTITSALAIPSEDRIMIYELVAVSGVITTVTDWRARSKGITDTS